MDDGIVGPIFGFILAVGLLVLYFVPLVKIVRKAGYRGWWSLMVLIPLVNIIMLYVFAFSDWPALRNHRQ
jgi:hypothetical protein